MLNRLAALEAENASLGRAATHKVYDQAVHYEKPVYQDQTVYLNQTPSRTEPVSTVAHEPPTRASEPFGASAAHTYELSRETQQSCSSSSTVTSTTPSPEEVTLLVAENMSLLSPVSKAKNVRVWRVLEHSTKIEIGVPRGTIPKSAQKVYFLSHKWDDRHQFQPDFYCGVNSDTQRLVFSDTIKSNYEANGYVFHCQYYMEHDKTEYYDFRVMESKSMKTVWKIESNEAWEAYFTVVQRYPRSSATSTKEIDWKKEYILALHCGSDKHTTIHEFMQSGDEHWGNIAIDRFVVVGTTCNITWYLDPGPKGEFCNPIVLLRLPVQVEDIIPRNISPPTPKDVY